MVFSELMSESSPRTPNQLVAKRASEKGPDTILLAENEVVRQIWKPRFLPDIFAILELTLVCVPAGTPHH